jgi:hypothetical protein
MTLNLFHYFDIDTGPFRNLSELPYEEALKISNLLRQEGMTFASQRPEDYISIRRELEFLARNQFIAKGGKPKNIYPHYMTLEACDWLGTWYRKPGMISISWEDFLEESISFTYGDLFPTMRYQDKKPYRKQVYIKTEIKEIIKQFGFPQEWNNAGDKGPERYIEVQIWDDDIIKKYKC